MEPAAPATTDPALAATLRDLADVALPAPVSMLPQTWGWAVLGAIILAAVAAALWLWLRRRATNRYRREALSELAGIEQYLADPATRGMALAQLPPLLKRVALAAWPRETVADLNGPLWVGFLAARSGGARLSPEFTRFFEEAEYRGEDALGLTDEKRARAYAAAARQWIEGHDVRA
ncbi:DUF4381 domain-containing protein [Sinorhizobium mexicanum]|uniref:DUF4381 domain-containing protein n=1 Tax=Sinorhizobium mexicanum TaxID=375549 RepID=A0A859R395_9HYPH|nr:DUF4381 domain-containing protein [Sinorhizobium mexicanum]MBP1886849.1 hypothetical protein [Sinorhizobium mexicanum]QLL66049.1 DUF4381 domain-containing protein [Sinorhizobium mexicanum]